MSKAPPIALPWQRQGAYLLTDTLVTRGIISGRWSKSTVDTDNDGAPELTTTRTRDACGRVTRVEIVDARDAGQNKTVTVAYDDLGRVATLDIQEKVRPRTLTYEYDSGDRLVSETVVATDLNGVRHTTVATHTLDCDGATAATVATTDGTKREEREYTPFGAIRAMRVFDDGGHVVTETQSTFDCHRRETSRVTRTFEVDPGSGKSRQLSEVVEENSYFGDTDRQSRTHRLETQSFEKSPGVFLFLKAQEETQTFAPVTGGVEHLESRLFNPGPNDEPVETAVRIEDRTIDPQGRPTVHTGTNTDHNTGESKAVRTVTTYRAITVATTDLQADGTDDEEMVTITDEAGRVVESREGKPDFGPFTRRQKLAYDEQGELVRRVRFENNSDKPSSVETFS